MFLLTNGLHIPPEDFITPSEQTARTWHGKQTNCQKLSSEELGDRIRKLKFLALALQATTAKWVVVPGWRWRGWRRFGCGCCMWLARGDVSELLHDGNAKWFVSLYGNCCLLFILLELSLSLRFVFWLLPV